MIRSRSGCRRQTRKTRRKEATMKEPTDNTPGMAVEIVTGGSLADILKMHTGEANKEAPHLTVPFYMPLALPMSFEDGLTCISPALRKKARSGAITLVAVAQGHMAPPGEEPSQVQFVLFFDTDQDAPGYYVSDT